MAYQEVPLEDTLWKYSYVIDWKQATLPNGIRGLLVDKLPVALLAYKKFLVINYDRGIKRFFHMSTFARKNIFSIFIHPFLSLCNWVIFLRYWNRLIQDPRGGMGRTTPTARAPTPAPKAATQTKPTTARAVLGPNHWKALFSQKLIILTRRRPLTKFVFFFALKHELLNPTPT